MTAASPPPQGQDNKEYNFRRLEGIIEKQNEEIAALKRAKEVEEDQEDDEPYVNQKKLEKKLSHFSERTKKETQNDIKQAIREALEEEKREQWLSQHPDFEDVINKHSQTLYDKDKDLGNAILKIPEGFDRFKLLYKSIKAMKIDEPAPKELSIQEQIESRKKGPYYQPSNVGSAPMSQFQGDFSDAGKKTAYDHMQALKQRIRL